MPVTELKQSHYRMQQIYFVLLNNNGFLQDSCSSCQSVTTQAMGPMLKTA